MEGTIDMTARSNIIIESPGVNVAVVKKDDDGWKFLVLRRADTESYGGFWGFMTGSKQPDETVAQLVVRELMEETGLRPQSMWGTEYLVQFYEPEFDKIWILPVIVAVMPTTAKVKLSAENSEFLWLSADQAKHRVSWRNLVRAIDDVAEELEIFPARNWVELIA
jgi:dihydroneopterin triphosphate diphosphatase